MTNSIELKPIYDLIKKEIEVNPEAEQYFISSKREIQSSDSDYEEYEGWLKIREEFDELMRWIFDGEDLCNYYYVKHQNVQIVKDQLESLFENKYEITFDIKYHGGRGIGDLYDLDGLIIKTK